jgi:N-acetylmuramoyl-L-alanine amidase
MIIADAPSPNFGPRKEGKKLKYLILHYTGTETAFNALKLLQGGRDGHDVSAHYLIDETGVVTRIVNEEMRAWHAGKSYWEGEEDINSCSIGIEIHNPGHEYGYVPFPDIQIKSVTELCSDIIQRQKILPYHVLAHSDIAPGRKEDPGELFPWASLSKQGIGLWPQVTDQDEFAAEEILDKPDEIKSILTRFGYDPRLDLKILLTAFQRHFVPDVFLTPDRCGEADLNTVKRLVAIKRQKLALRPKIT